MDKKFKDIEKKLNEQKDKFEKMKMENDKKLLEQMKKEKQRKIQEIREKKIAIEQCKKYLSEEFINCIINSFNEYRIQDRKWIKQITQYDIEKRKNEFCFLFKRLFIIENIENKLTNKFIEIIKKKYINNELRKMNL